jgi:uncharacterized protein (DUF2141 family)
MGITIGCLSRKEIETMKTRSKSLEIALNCLLCCAILAGSALTLTAQTRPTPAATPAAPVQSTPAPSAPAQATSTLTVKIKGIRNAKGKIDVVLYGNANGFPLDPSNAAAVKQVNIDPQSLTATVVFEKLPQGVYAATVLHDENLVGKIEFDSAGTPLEGYGISNNPDTSQGPPTFDESKFTVGQPDAAIEIAMVYWQ